MSEAPRFPAAYGYGGLRMTADEYLALGETRDRYELIDGVVIMSPSPTPRHQRVAFLLAVQMEHVARTSGEFFVVPDVDVRMSVDRVYRPDIVVYARERQTDLPDRFTTPPDLVVEVLSPGSEPLDYITKRDDYERFGVGEYWVVNPSDVSVRIWRRQGTRMLEAGVVADRVHAPRIPSLVVDLQVVRSSI